VLNYSDNTVSVVNSATHVLIKNITVGTNPNLAAISPDGRKIYVTNYDSNNVTVIDTSVDDVVKTFAVGNGADGVAVSPDGVYVYITNINDNTVSLARAFTNRVIKTIPSGRVSPNNVGFVAGGFAYITNGGSDDTPDNRIGVISPATQDLTKVIAGGNRPADIRPNASGNYVYVPNFADNTVSVINTVRQNVVSSFPVGTFPVSIAVIQR
jgi:large repetitive protein